MYFSGIIESSTTCILAVSRKPYFSLKFEHNVKDQKTSLQTLVAGAAFEIRGKTKDNSKEPEDFASNTSFRAFECRGKTIEGNTKPQLKPLILEMNTESPLRAKKETQPKPRLQKTFF